MKHSRPLSFLAVLPALTILLAAPNSFAGSGGATVDASSDHRINPGQTLHGKATIYPDSLNGHTTAMGGTFHQSEHTAASNKLPLGTKVKVTNVETGKSTHVDVTDRGPALGTRKIDLSKKAAREIGITRKEGTAPVKIEVTGTPDGPGTQTQK